jgi:hypothetical protein
MSPRFFRPLLGIARLEFRRTLLCAPMALFVLWCAILAGGDYASEIGARLGEQTPRVARGIAREALLGGALSFLLPWLLLRAGGAVSRWRRGEVDWMGSAPTTRAAALGGAWCGIGAAGTIAIAAAALFVSLRVGAGESSWQFVGSQRVARPLRVEPGERLELDLALPAGAGASQELRARIHLARTLGGGRERLAREAEVQLELQRGHGVDQARVRERFRIHGRARVEIALPPAPREESAGGLRLEISNPGDASIALLPDRTIELWQPGGTEGGACLDLALRCSLALAAGLALALGLGAWVGAATAAGGAFALWLLSTTLEGARAWLPGARLLRDFEFLRDGLLPENFDPRWIPGALLVVGCGALIGVLGLRSWRHTP